MAARARTGIRVAGSLAIASPDDRGGRPAR